MTTSRDDGALQAWSRIYLLAVILTSVFGASVLPSQSEVIDRRALVTRHNPVLAEVDPEAPLTVGNGRFAFTADITGLQTFPDHYYRCGIPLETQARWCWATEPNTNDFKIEDANEDFRRSDGRKVALPTKASSPAGDWLRRNPHVQPLVQIGFELRKRDGSTLLVEDVKNPHQTLDMWSGVINSRFELEGQRVEVTTVCHPSQDIVAIQVNSSLLSQGKLRIRIAFPRGYDSAVRHSPPLDWSKPESHHTVVVEQSPNGLRMQRTVESTSYTGVFAWSKGARLIRASEHVFTLSETKGESSTVEMTTGFYPGSDHWEPSSSHAITLQAAARHWQSFWKNGGALDLSGSTDPRAFKLERRVVLSRYLMATQMAGDVPPQESGLTCSTWFGKHHTEMIWWHTAHFALWNHDDLLAHNLEWFRSQLPAARALAFSRGLRGARWAKMTGPELRESPGGNPLIVWNQPHPIFLCELLYRNSPSPATLKKYSQLVLETADCLASMVHLDTSKGTYVLGPPLWIAQEIYDPATSSNPCFELAYWKWALDTAQRWRERAGMRRLPEWDDIIHRLSPLPQKDGKYVALESTPDTFENKASRHDHPTMLAPLGMLPGSGVDRDTMERTLRAVLASWDWETKIWGWDYPMIAMTAARLGHPDIAVDVLLRPGPNNIYTACGHCPQRTRTVTDAASGPGVRRHELPAYLPANGAFLTAVALMASGWEGSTNHAPGFPHDGRWKVRYENLHQLP